MIETTWILDEQSGALTIEGLSRFEMYSVADDLLTESAQVNCARPLNAVPLAQSDFIANGTEATLRVYRIYHGSVVEGSGRRSVVQLAGCAQRCLGCFVPETHPLDSGVTMSVREVVSLLLSDEGEPRDGITILGGEPFLQPAGLLALVQSLKQNAQHLMIYSGYTLEQLLAREDAECLRHILSLTDILIDGPFVKALADGAGEWRGSTNQRILAHPFAHTA